MSPNFVAPHLLHALHPSAAASQLHPAARDRVPSDSVGGGMCYSDESPVMCTAATQARHDKLGGPRPALRVVSYHADDTNRAPTFDIDLDDLFEPDGRALGCTLSAINPSSSLLVKGHISLHSG